MRVRTSVVVTLVASVTVIAAQAPKSPMREGRWEITTQMQMPDLPIKMPETKTTQCVTAEDLKDPASALPEGQGQDSCKLTDYTVSGNTISWKMACSAPQAMSGSAELVFSGDTYTGTVLMNTAKGDMTLQLAGKRVGDCTE